MRNDVTEPDTPGHNVFVSRHRSYGVSKFFFFGVVWGWGVQWG